MQVDLEQLPESVAELKAMVLSVVGQANQALQHKQLRIELLEEKLRLLQQQRFGASSEKHPGQGELQLWNEAELLVAAAVAELEPETIPVAGHSRQRKPARVLPAELPRVDIVHDLPESQKTCDCGEKLVHIGDEVLEQLAIVPQRFFVRRHLRRKYACACKGCMRSAAMPAQPLPASQASPQLLAHVMVSKYHDALPLYRQEKMARREGLELPRAKLARWLIEAATLFQVLYNLLQDAFSSYDIAFADETGIQVLKEDGRTPQSKSYLWLRRGGPPEQPVVLVDYAPSRAGHIAHGLLEDFNGYLVCDAYGGYGPSIKANGLLPVYCNDHARRKFAEVLKGLIKTPADQHKAQQWVATQALAWYQRLYALEARAKHYTPLARLQLRQLQALPLWDSFLRWAKDTQAKGVAHTGTREALQYLLNHADNLRRYCSDGRLPISNILSEHVAKTIALARKNFLFADTAAGAHASAMIYSVLESAKANQHHPQQYLSILLTELPNAATVEHIESLLPWNITPAAPCVSLT